MKLEKPKIITKLKNHSRIIRTQAEKIKYEIENNISLDEAPKRQYIEGITIDKANSKDLDDGIWAEKTKNGYSIFVSIADVSEIIKPGTDLDLEAYSRSTSVYTNNHVYHMFPSEISTDLASLNDKTKRKTLTTRIDLDNNFIPIHTEIFEAIFKNNKRFTYDEFNKQFNNYGEKYHNELNLFHKIAKGLYKNRISRGGKNNFKENVTLKINKTENNNHSIASFIIQEFSIISNIENAKHIYKEKINGIFRLHMPELKGIITSNTPTQRAFYNHKNGYHFGLAENFYGHFTSPIRRYADLINHRQQKAWIRDKKSEIYSKNNIREIVLNINSAIEKTLNIEKYHNKEVLEKKVKRFLKKLEYNKYENISSVSGQHFSEIIKYILNKNTTLNNYIEEEIIYRIQNDLLDQKSIARIKSSSNELTYLNHLKEIITKKEENFN